MYKIRNKDTQFESIIRENNDDSISFIPKNLDNTDYQAYLKWLDEGNTPLPADEGVN